MGVPYPGPGVNIPGITSGGVVVTPLPPWPTPTIPPPVTEPRVSPISQSAEGQAIPLVYGIRRIQGRPFVYAAGANGALVVAYMLCSGPIQAITSWTLNDQSPSGMTGLSYETKTGAAGQTISSILAAAISGYTQTHPALAYIVVSISPNAPIWGGVPELQAIVQGRNDVYDPRSGGSTGYTANPALIACHMLVKADLGRHSTALVDWTSVGTAADWCDTNCSGVARYYQGVYLTDTRQLSRAFESVLSQAQLWHRWSTGGTIQLGYYNSAAASLATVDMDWLVCDQDGRGPAQVAEWIEDLTEQPTVVTVRFPNATRDWETDSYPAKITGVDAGTVPRRDLYYSADWITHMDVAKRLAEDLLAEYSAALRWQVGCNRRMFPYEKGDVLTTSSVEGCPDGRKRVLHVQPLTDGRVVAELAEEYTRTVATATADGKTPVSVPDPSATPPDPTGLTLTVKTLWSGGERRYEIEVTWTLAASSFVRGYQVECTVGATSRVIGTYSRDCAACIITVDEPGLVHYVTVKSQSIFLIFSSGTTQNCTPGGTPTVTITPGACSFIRLRHPLQPQSLSYVDYCDWYVNLAWTVTDATSQLHHLELIRNEVVLGFLPVTATAATVRTATKPSALNGYGNASGDFIAACDVADTFKLKGVWKDGRETLSSAFSLGSPSSDFPNGNTTISANDLVCGHEDQTYRPNALMPATGASPVACDVPFFDGTNWTYQMVNATILSFGASDTVKRWNHGLGCASPAILLGPEEDCQYWWVYVDANNIDVYRDNASGGAKDCAVAGFFG